MPETEGATPGQLSWYVLRVAEALRATRAEGLRIVPTCWMVAEYIDKHPEYAHITDRR